MDCIFCGIISGEIPSAAIYEDDEFKVILDRFPSAPGHVLILPKRHYADIFEIDPAAAGRLFELAVKVARGMKAKLGFENMNVLQNNGEVAGQTVRHFHLHLIPRYKDDSISIKWKMSKPSDDEIARMQKRLQMDI